MRHRMLSVACDGDGLEATRRVWLLGRRMGVCVLSGAVSASPADGRADGHAAAATSPLPRCGGADAESFIACRSACGSDHASNCRRSSCVASGLGRPSSREASGADAGAAAAPPRDAAATRDSTDA